MSTSSDTENRALPPINSTTTGGQDSSSPQNYAAISAPIALADGAPDLEARSVRDVAQAVGICSTAETNNRTRALRCTAVQNLHDMAPPRSFNDKLQKGQLWQANLSTGSMSGLTQRVVYRFVQDTTTALTLTHSTLPESYPNWKDKTDLLQSKVTELYRDWNGFTPLMNQIAVENVLQGYCLPLWLSPTDWKPVFFKQERALVPEGAKMDVKELQWIMGKIDYPVSEFCQLFSDEKAAEKSGYDISNCERAATHAVVAQEGDDYLTTEPRRFSELINQGTWGVTYGNGGVRCVKCWILANKEYDGQVSFWLLSREAGADKALLRYVFKAFPKMDKFAGLMAFEPGNGTIHSSKGIGRRLFNLCTALELARCQMIDAAFMGNMMIMRADAPARNKGVMNVLAPFLIVPKENELLPVKFPVTVSDLAALDNLLNGWMQQGVGAYISDVVSPGSSDDNNKTATAKKIDFSREQESAAMALARWEDQTFGSLFWTMQKRALSDDNLKKARKIYLKIVNDETGRVDRPSLYGDESKGDDPQLMRKLVEIFTHWPMDDARPQTPDGADLEKYLDDVIDEIGVWRDTAATIKANLIKTTQAAAVDAVIAQWGQTPQAGNLDMAGLQQLSVENNLGPTLTKKYYLANGPQTQNIEAQRAQLDEIATMITLATMVPVSPRDNHIVHAQTCQQWLTAKAAPALSNVQANDTVIMQAENMLNHMGAHLQAASQTPDAKSPDFKELEKFYAGFKGQLQDVVEIHAHAAAAQQLAQSKLSVDGGANNPVVGQNGAANQTAAPNPPMQPTPAASELSPSAAPTSVAQIAVPAGSPSAS